MLSKTHYEVTVVEIPQQLRNRIEPLLQTEKNGEHSAGSGSVEMSQQLRRRETVCS